MKIRKIRTYNGKTPRGRLFAVFAVVLSVISSVAASTIFFQVEAVEVEGQERYTPEQIMVAADVETGSNLVLLSENLISDRVCRGLAYVESVHIERKFPTTMRILVTESKPAAVIACEGQYWVIDPDGKIMEQVDESQSQMAIAVSGLELVEPELGDQIQVAVENQPKLQGLLNLLGALRDKDMLEKVSQISCASRTEISMLYEGRLNVKFLINADFERKIRILEDVVAVLGDGEGGTINLKSEPVYKSAY